MSTEHTFYPALSDIEAARTRLHGIIQQTPLEHSRTFSELSQNNIYLKLENLQKTGSFKLRGAYNKIASLTDEERSRGVIAASAGNHAQGVAYGARAHRTPCTIVMPESAPLAKVLATNSYGAKVVLHGSSYDDAYAYARSLQEQHGFTYVHAFDDPLVIAGQGTIGLEILEQLPSTSAILVAMGGGGLATGVAIAVKALRPDIKVFGVEAANAACFRHSFNVGHLDTIATCATIADGIAVKRPGDLTYELAQNYVDEVFTVEEEEIARTMVLLMERSKLVSEGAAACALAAAIYNKIPANLGDVVAVLSGGNVDITFLARIIEHGLVESGRYLRLSVNLADKPGALRDLLDVIAGLRANVISIQHHRVGTSITLGETEVDIHLETRDHQHIQSITTTLRERNYKPISRW